MNIPTGSEGYVGTEVSSLLSKQRTSLKSMLVGLAFPILILLLQILKKLLYHLIFEF